MSCTTAYAQNARLNFPINPRNLKASRFRNEEGLARQARRTVWQNLAFAMAVILVLILSAFGANLPLPLGVVGHEGSTVLVVLNGLRLLTYHL